MAPEGFELVPAIYCCRTVTKQQDYSCSSSIYSQSNYTIVNIFQRGHTGSSILLYLIVTYYRISKSVLSFQYKIKLVPHESYVTSSDVTKYNKMFLIMNNKMMCDVCNLYLFPFINSGLGCSDDLQPFVLGSQEAQRAGGRDAPRSQPPSKGRAPSLPGRGNHTPPQRDWSSRPAATSGEGLIPHSAWANIIFMFNQLVIQRSAMEVNVLCNKDVLAKGAGLCTKSYFPSILNILLYFYIRTLYIDEQGISFMYQRQFQQIYKGIIPSHLERRDLMNLN